MSIEEWEHYFKPEVRSSGRRYFTAGNVSVSQPSDTEILAYIRGSSSFKVSFKSPSMQSKLITVDCNCPPSKRGQLCKHIWATLLSVKDKKPDFLDGKEEIKKKADHEPAEANSFQKPTKPLPNLQQRPMSDSQVKSKTSFKAKQNDYRKQQYQKQKQRLKDRKQANKKTVSQGPVIPENVQAALVFFSENGFPMDNPPKAEAIQTAKKKLARIFHPDIGGSHAEILELNKNSEALLEFIEAKKRS